MGEQMRTLSARKLDEVEALLERTRAMKGWLEVAQECGCATPAECALFDAPEEALADPEVALRIVEVAGKDCRRPVA
jgi:hypothetical protein